MNRIVRTSIIVHDSYNNILAIHRGKKNSQEIWSIIGKDLKGKETEEKCIAKAVDNDLGCVIFDLNKFKEYVIDVENGESLLVYTGVIRQHVSLHKTINKIKWISKDELDKHTFSANEKEILMDYFKLT